MAYRNKLRSSESLWRSTESIREFRIQLETRAWIGVAGMPLMVGATLPVKRCR
ncbi:hypothetical protein K788_0001597 (plasmid) [Paraburkholderia caribensis MBA4]|uniref:Uncharacterized protein n=1 Tax=Paraburkholderia caribensis MBA4 TaxID=1323664 RepID=A0A0P0RMM3_9BURK|nr:hypothetical protein [Paraburkholderia caribensis]ALL70046.1 hypothetical protein K788_0001597 [Paraburkholderia caribensis MBA4]